MFGLDKIVSKLTSKNIGNIRNRIEQGIESLGNRIKEYAETGIDRTREYLETAGKYVINTGNKIREKVETAKEVMPYALMNTLISNRWGQAGFLGGKALIAYQVSKGNSGGWNSKIPYIVGSITGALGLGIGILLGDFHILGVNHQYQELQQQLEHQYQDLQQQYQELQQQYQNLETQYQDLQQQDQNVDNQYQDLQQQYQNLQQQYQNLETQYQNLETQYQDLQQQYQNLDNQYQNLETQYQNLQQQYQNLETQYQDLQQQYQNLEQQLQNINTLTDVLFGNSNSNDISVIQVNSVQIENGTAYIQGTVGFTGNNVTLEIPIGYAENNNVNIQEFVSVVQQYQQNGWNPYISIDRADLQYMNLLNNQNGTYVISIQPNEPINIGVMASTANSSTLDSVLNNLGHYTMLIQDGNQGNYAVYGDPNAFYGYLPSVTSSTGGTVVINFPAGSQYYSQAETMINIADQIINSPGNQNPTSSGYIDTYDIFSVNSTGAYQGFPEYNVGQIYIPLIVLQSGQGNTIISDVSS